MCNYIADVRLIFGTQVTVDTLAVYIYIYTKFITTPYDSYA